MNGRRIFASPRALAILAAVGVGLIALLFLARTLHREGYRRIGTNIYDVPTHAIVPPGKRLCQPGEWVPHGTGAVYPWVGGENGKPGGLMTLTVSAPGGQVLATGRSSPTFPTGLNRFKLDRTIDHDVRGATLCFTNRSHETAFMYGSPASGGIKPAQAPAYQDGVPAAIRLDYYAPGVVSYWSQLGRIADRFPLTKAGFLGPWSFWVCMVVLLGLAAAAAVRIVREAPR
jgi:hypothetical protein